MPLYNYTMAQLGRRSEIIRAPYEHDMIPAANSVSSLTRLKNPAKSGIVVQRPEQCMNGVAFQPLGEEDEIC